MILARVCPPQAISTPTWLPHTHTIEKDRKFCEVSTMRFRWNNVSNLCESLILYQCLVVGHAKSDFGERMAPGPVFEDVCYTKYISQSTVHIGVVCTCLFSTNLSKRYSQFCLPSTKMIFPSSLTLASRCFLPHFEVRWWHHQYEISIQNHWGSVFIPLKPDWKFEGNIPGLYF